MSNEKYFITFKQKGEICEKYFGQDRLIKDIAADYNLPPHKLGDVLDEYLGNASTRVNVTFKPDYNETDLITEQLMREYEA